MKKKKNPSQLSQLVLKKIQEKRQKQIINTPNIQIIKIMLQNSITSNKSKIQYKQNILKELRYQKQQIQNMQISLEDLGNMIWKQHLFINIKPQFYASQKISTNIKQFYRKAANNFFKFRFKQEKTLAQYILKKQEIQKYLVKIKELENTIKLSRESYRIQKENQLIENIKQKLKYEEAVMKGKKISDSIKQIIQQNHTIANQYEHKKEKIDEFNKKIKILEDKIEKQQQLYEKTYNIVTRRQYLQRLFNITFKIQCLENQIIKSKEQFNKINQNTQKIQNAIIRKHSASKFDKIKFRESKYVSTYANTIDIHRQSTAKKKLKTQRTSSTIKKSRTITLQ